MSEFKASSIYLGIIVQNNDPEKRGRCKIFVPHVTSYIYDNWSKDKTDKVFNFIDNEDNDDVQEILHELQTVLPWGEYAGQIFGGNSSGRYNATTKKGYTEDHNQWDDDQPAFSNRPAATYNNASPARDAFSDSSNVNIVNPYSYGYAPTDNSTLAAGMFSIPNVGSHVWCFFEDGDVNCPVYFASSYSTEDIKRIYTTNKYTTESVTTAEGEFEAAAIDGSPDYPGAYENIDMDVLDDDSKTFRSKHTINSNKNTIELIDTDNREAIKFTHYSGSFKEFNNFATTEFATKNYQSLVVGNSFETIRRSKNVYVDKDSNEYIDGDCIERVGNYDVSTTQQIRALVAEINERMQLFDLRRVLPYESSANIPNFLSPLQKREKSSNPDKPALINDEGFTVCPVCQNNQYVFDLASYEAELQPKRLVTSLVQILGPAISCLTPYPALAAVGIGNLPSFIQAIPDIEGLDLQIMQALTELQTKISGDSPPGIGIYAGAKCDICNSDLLPADFPDKVPGFSPSSQNGEFEVEDLKGDSLDKLIIDTAPALIELERKLEGGDKIVEIHKNKIETIGTVMNTFGSIRVDPIGKLRAENVYVAPESVYQGYRPAPHIEPVAPLDVPGGDYILTATNKYKLLVGAKGINIKTFGPIDMYGTIVNITGQQLNLSTQYETSMDGGDRLSLRARKIALTPKEHSPVLVDGALHVTRNAIVKGGMYVEGQFGTPAIASLREYGQTSDGIWTPPAAVPPPVGEEIDPCGVPTSAPPTGNSYIACGNTGPILPFYPLGVPVAVLIPPHTHLYERPPSQLFNSLQALRTYFADPSGMPVRSAGASSSINDVNSMRAAAPVNDLAVGENSLVGATLASTLAPQVKELLDSDLFNYLNPQFQSISVVSAKSTIAGVCGVLSITFSTNNPKLYFAYSVSFTVAGETPALIGVPVQIFPPAPQIPLPLTV